MPKPGYIGLSLNLKRSRVSGTFPVAKNQRKLSKNEVLGNKWSTVFFGKSGHIATIRVKGQRTVPANWYLTECLPKVFRRLRLHNLKRRIILYQDNAPAHRAKVTTASANASGTWIIPRIDLLLFENIYRKNTMFHHNLQHNNMDRLPTATVHILLFNTLKLTCSNWNRRPLSIAGLVAFELQHAVGESLVEISSELMDLIEHVSLAEPFRMFKLFWFCIAPGGGSLAGLHFPFHILFDSIFHQKSFKGIVKISIRNIIKLQLKVISMWYHHR